MSLNYVVIISLLLIVIGLLFFLKSANIKEPKDIDITAYQKRYILTKSENVFFKKLRKAIPMEYTIFSQVPFSCIVKSKDKNNRALFWKINQKRVDFVILDKNLNTLFIVELDDKSHNGKERRDKERDHLFLNCGIPTVRFNDKYENSIEEIKEKVTNYLLCKE